MRILRAIVEVAALPVLDIRQQLSLCHAVASKLVGGQDTRRILQTLQQLPKEALRRPGVAAALHQDIEHDAMLIDGAPQVAQLTPDPDGEASGAGQLRPRALSEPDVILSHHPAPIVVSVRPEPRDAALTQLCLALSFAKLAYPATGHLVPDCRSRHRDS